MLVVLMVGCQTLGEPVDGDDVVRDAKVSYEAWRAMPNDGRLRERHEVALERLLGWVGDVPAGSRVAVMGERGLTYEIESKEVWEEFVLARKVDRKRVENWHGRSGVGVPVVALRKNEGVWPLDSLRPPEGISTSLTAVLTRLDDGGYLLKMLDPMEHATVKVGDEMLPLAADFSASIAILLKEAEALRKSGRSGMLKPGLSARKEKLYLMQPYDAKKIPLVMVHGLQSTPVAFGNLTNDVLADPRLYERYQVWHYHYPTGMPVLQNAAVFRRVLDETLKLIDPEGDDFATNHLVVIGHSMGGILTHTLTCDSGYVIWDKVMRSRPDRFVCQPAFRERLEPIFLFKRDRRVKRVVFVAVPHRGSGYADNWIGDLGQRLFRGDEAFHSVFHELVKHHREDVHPFLLKLVDAGKVSSIRTLSGRSPALVALAGIKPEVPFHNIMGQKKEGPVEEGSDGIVPYASSRMEGAESELIVRSGHNAFRHPEAVKEIKRILKMHVGR